jgi:hypothetical protein
MKKEIDLLCPTSDGFEFRISGKGRESVRWDDVEFAELFKQDLLTTDVVCMNLKLKSDVRLSLTEELQGFTEVVKAMNKEWSLGDEWYGKVVLPPFETCKVVITPPAESTGQKAVLEWSQS